MFASKDVFFKSSGGGGLPARSLRTRNSFQALRTPSVAGNRKTWTFASWVKLGSDNAIRDAVAFSAALNGLNYFSLNIGNQTLVIESVTSSSRVWSIVANINRKISTDPTGWRHICLAFDSTQATATDRVKIYINGQQVNSNTYTYTAPTLNYDEPYVNNTRAQAVGSYATSGGQIDGLITESYFIDGLALIPTDFCEYNTTTGELQPKKYTGAYGTNGFYIDYRDPTTASTLVKDVSGNGNNLTPTGISVTAGGTYDSFFDYPANFDGGTYVNGNYATLSIRDSRNNWTRLDVTYGGYTLNPSITTAYYQDSAFDLSTGKYYWEFTTGTTGTTNCNVQLQDRFGAYLGTFNQPNNTTYGYRYDNTTGIYQYTPDGTAWTTIITVSTTAGEFYAIAVAYTNTALSPAFFNPGSRAFTYTVPTGYKATCTQNAASPPLVPSQYFQSTRYLGNGSARSIDNTYHGVSSLAFKPDMIWIPSKNALNPAIWDIIQTPTFTQITSGTTPSFADAQSITAFNTNGFSVGTSTQVNGATDEFFAFQWRGAGSTSTNTQGSITSTVSANASAGFSVVRYTGNGTAGATVGHGLGAAPQFIMVKNMGASFDWACYWASSGANVYQVLNSTAAVVANINWWNNTTATSTVFSVGIVGATNASTANYNAYCFTSIPGYSKVGSYTGNTNVGKFISLGFKPSWILIKSTGTANWVFVDANASYGQNQLYRSNNPNVANPTSTTDIQITFLTTGFLLENNSGVINTNAQTYNYVAVAETGFKFALGR